MNANAKAWIEALRSGKYRKAKGQLHYTEKGKDYFCCFGIACQLYQEANPEDSLIVKSFHMNEKGVSNKRIYHSYDNRAGYLPEKVRVWLGLTDCIGTHKGDLCGIKVPFALIKYNDSDDQPDDGSPPEKNYTFKELADLIETAQDLFTE
jgi:hypothetical protein